MFIKFILNEFLRRTGFKFKFHLLNQLNLYLIENPCLTPILFNQLTAEINKLQNIVPTDSLSKYIFFYSKICTNFKWKTLDDNCRKSLVQSHAILCGFYAKNKIKIHFELHFKQLESFFVKLDQDCLNEYCTVLKNLSSNSTQSIEYLILWNNLIRYDTKDHYSIFSTYKDFILEQLNKSVIMSKIKISETYGAFCFENIFTRLDFKDFSDTILPSLQKSILRSAETSLSLLVYIFEPLKFDLSPISQGKFFEFFFFIEIGIFFSEIGKILGNFIHSKEETLQEESLHSVQIFIKKCSSTESVEFLICHFAKIFNGSEGKLTVLSQKVSVIKSIGILSFHNVKDSVSEQQVFNTAIGEFVKICKQETVESNLVLLFNQIKLWIQNNSRCLMPKLFFEFLVDFKKSKLATAAVLVSLFDCLSTLLKIEDNFQKHINLFDEQLISLVINSSKNITSSLAKIQILTESLYSSTVLLQIYGRNKSMGMLLIPFPLFYLIQIFKTDNVKNFLNTISQLNKVTFLSDKFILESPSDNLHCLVDFISLTFQNIDVSENDKKYLILFNYFRN